jgi:hypothetical protein
MTAELWYCLCLYYTDPVDCTIPVIQPSYLCIDKWEMKSSKCAEFKFSFFYHCMGANKLQMFHQGLVAAADSEVGHV